jgi:ABC-type multidrug transport system fused ATPase/permease subunit
VSPFSRLLAYLQPYRSDFVKGLLAVVATTGVTLTAPWVLQQAIDDLTLGVTRGKLAWYGVLLVGIGVVGGVFRFLMRRILTGASRHIEYDLRNDFFAHLQRLPPSFFQRHRTGDLMSRATSDLNAVRMMVGPSVMYSANTLLGFAGGLTLMLAIDAWLTLIALLPLPFVSLSVKNRGKPNEQRVMVVGTKMIAHNIIFEQIQLYQVGSPLPFPMLHFKSRLRHAMRNNGLLSYRVIFLKNGEPLQLRQARRYWSCEMREVR